MELQPPFKVKSRPESPEAQRMQNIKTSASFKSFRRGIKGFVVWNYFVDPISILQNDANSPRNAPLFSGFLTTGPQNSQNPAPLEIDSTARNHVLKKNPEKILSQQIRAGPQAFLALVSPNPFRLPRATTHRLVVTEHPPLTSALLVLH